MSNYSYGSIVRLGRENSSDGQIASLIGEKVGLKSAYVYGIIEAIRLGSNPGIKIAGEWYTGKDINHIVMLTPGEE